MGLQLFVGLVPELVPHHGWGTWSQGRHQKVGTWAPKANPRAMEEEREGVAWAPKANPRHPLLATEAPVAQVAKMAGWRAPRPVGRRRCPLAKPASVAFSLW